jgi:SAM-dependent methyltransferase
MALTGDWKDRRLEGIKYEPVKRYSIGKDDLLSEHSCPVCRGLDESLISKYSVDRILVHETVMCNDCGHVYRSVSPSAAWVDEMRRQFKAERFNELLSLDLELAKTRERAYAARLDMVSKYVTAKTCIDVGGANGIGYVVLTRAGYEVEVLEPDPHRAKALDSVCTVYQQPLESATDVTHKGLVIASHVLEHCSDVSAAMANLAKMMLPDGVLYIEVPHVLHIANWSDAMFFAHRHNFTAASFERLAAQAGLRIIEWRLVCHEDNRYDMAFVLTRGVFKELAYDPIDDDLRIQIKRAYRKGLPREFSCAELLYHAPYIDHFNYGLRFNRWSLEKDGTGMKFVGSQNAV